jgi:PucR C-terminal helix-turn-helix domain/GGDEF-like domain
VSTVSRIRKRQGLRTDARAELHDRLQASRLEIEQAVLTRVNALAGQSDSVDPEYLEGLPPAVSAALEYGFAAIERGDERSPPVPPVLLAQARLAARCGVSLDTVLRRYFAGYTLLGDFVIGKAENGGLPQGSELKSLQRSLASFFDRLLVAVCSEYTRELESRFETLDQRRVERVRRLLAGEMVDTSQFAYDFEGAHLGAVVSGANGEEALQELASTLGQQPLLVPHGEGTLWAWLGSKRKLDLAELERVVSSSWPSDVTVAIGEPGEGLAGWRLTHRQASAAFPVALRSPETPIRYSEVALLASMLKDDLLASSLRELYLAPLVGGRDGGEAMRQTLRAYFAAERNVSSAAAALGVNRHTVASRLRTVEERLGRPLTSCAAEMDAALRLEQLDAPVLPNGAMART